jgi:pimeloyl-ACP methyl ester carboxylesterase
LLHGWTATADLNWGACYAGLAPQVNVVALDQRGHGRGIRGPFTLEACADDAAALIGALGHHDPTAILEAARALVGYRADSWLGAIEVPAAVVMTTADHLVPPGRQLLLAHGIPGCSLFAVDGDHGVCSMRPDRFVPALLAALADVGSRAQSRPRRAVAAPSAA